MTATKTCTKCGITKPLKEFRANPSSKDGHLSTCKTCTNVYKRAQHQYAQSTQTDHIPRSKGCFVPAKLPHSIASGALTYTPLKPSDLPQPTLRPGASDHEKYGSRQADGSVKPFTRIGYLSSSVRVNFAYKEK